MNLAWYKNQILAYVQIVQDKSRNARGASHHDISHTCQPYLPSRKVSPAVLYPIMIA